MNPFRDLYSHIVFVGGTFMQETLNIIVIAGGREFHITEKCYDFAVSGFWKIDYETHIYNPNKNWHILDDDPFTQDDLDKL